MMYDWGDLKHFLAVAETGSLSAASKELGVSQPTVGRRLDALEQALGARLFVRTGQGMQVTEVGRSVLDHARTVRDHSSAIARLADKQDERPSGVVRISTIESTGEWVTTGLSKFQEKYPDIEVELVIEDHVADLASREADIAIRLFRPTQNTLIVRRLVTVLYSFYASEGFIERNGRPRTPDDLPNFDFIDWYEPKTTAWKKESLREEMGMPMHSVFRTNSATTSLQATVEGIGISRIPIALAERTPGLVRLFPDLVCAEMDIWLCAHADLRSIARIRALWDHIVAQSNEFRQTLPGVI